MENDKISQSEKMVKDGSLKTESCNSYCPDFSDIYDESYEFWDFLHSKKDINKSSSPEKEKENKFWDFLSSSSNIPQNGLWGSRGESNDSAFTTPNESEFYFQNKPQVDSQIKNKLGTAVSNSIHRHSPELKSASSDDEFWDFLSCNSPVVTFKELLGNYNPINDDKESGICSFVSRSDESPFASISECYESEICSTLNSTPSSALVRTKHHRGRKNETKEFDSRQVSKQKDGDKLKGIVEPTDYTNYIDVLKFLEQECIVGDKEVNSSMISTENICTKFNTKESEKYQKSLNASSNEYGKYSQQQGKIQVSSSSQRPVYDGTVPISCLNNFLGLKKDGNSNEMNSFKLNSQQTVRNQQLIDKRPTKRLKRNIQNRTMTSHFNTVGNSNSVLTTSRLNEINVVNFNNPGMHATLRNPKSANYYQAKLGSQSKRTARVNQFLTNPVVTHCAKPTITVSVANTTPNISSTNTTPLYLLMPTNSETIQNPNYSHFFLVINNNNCNAQMNQPTCIQTSKVSTNTNNVISTPIQIDQVLQSKVNTEVGNKSDNVVKQNILFVNQINKAGLSTSTSTSKSSVSNIKYQAIPQVYLPYTSFITSVEGTNQANVQNSNKIPAVINTVNIPVSVNNSALTSNIPTTVSNMPFFSAPNTSFYPTVKISGVPEQITNLKLDPKPKAMQAKCRQPLLNPIKNIPLGKDKYAIQQISTPVQICSTQELNSSLGYYSNLNNTNENSTRKNAFFENQTKSSINIKASEGLVNNNSKFSDTLSAISDKNFHPQNENCSNTSLKSVSAISSLAPTVCSIGKNANPQEKSRVSTTNSINVNVGPIPASLDKNENGSAVNPTQMLGTKNKHTASNINLNRTSNSIPLKVGNSQNKSLSTLQELFPPPISMIPVRVLPQPQAQSQIGKSKVLILNRKEQTVAHKLKIDPLPNRERPIPKKQREKTKKGRLKTVRELLQEQRKSSNKTGREIRVLRRVMKIPTCVACPSTSSPVITHITKLNPTVNSNSTVETGTRKRPNILVLPSSKTIMKNNFTEDKPGILVKEPETKRFADFSVSENRQDSLLSYSTSAFDKKDNRPRHYDMSQLNIGDFRVDDDTDSCGRFRSKFKVIFSKRLFYYDFPVSRCNQYSLKSTDTWERMARIAVPFKSVVSMSLNERMIEISINTPPTIALGRFQGRTGILPNSTMYDIAVESDCTWGCMIRSSFHHKVILQKKQATKLRTLLCHFDDRFLNIINNGLCESGVNNVDELSIFEGELSPTTLKQNVTKNKKNYIRRLSQWDSSENEDQKTVDEDDVVLLNQMCSCRVSCRSIRCSCVKAAKSCNTVCNCICCDNPLNILETLGMNLDFSLSDSCLFQNIYQIPKLVPFLTKEVKLTCCNTFARVQDCIPGTVLCPNVDCNVPLEFSWCKKVVCYPERNPRNHCSFCGQCGFSNGRHCMTCKRCYVVTPKNPDCPTCQEKSSVTTLKDMESNDYNYDIKCHHEQKNVIKSTQQPKIVISDVYSLPNSSTTIENTDESSFYKSSTDVSTNFKGCTSPANSVIVLKEIYKTKT